MINLVEIYKETKQQKQQEKKNMGYSSKCRKERKKINNPDTF